VQLTKGADTYYFNISWSPDSKKILFNDRKLRLRYVDIDSREIVPVRQAVYGTIYQFAWSPDSRYITYTEQTDNDNSVIRIFDTQTKNTYDVTYNWFSSSSPEFSNDGKYLVFTSARDFNPVYSQTEWNHAYTNMTRVYLGLLSRDTPNPFAPKNDEVKVQEIKTPATAKEAEKNKDKGKGKLMKPNRKKLTPVVKFTLTLTESKTYNFLPIDPSNYGNVSCV
jgi:tricorn protease